MRLFFSNPVCVFLVGSAASSAPSMAARSSAGGANDLHVAAGGGHKEKLLALLEAGCDTDEVDYCGLTPLVHAAFKGHTECLQLLIQHGADVHKKCTRTGVTAAHIAALGGHKQVLLTLLEAGCREDVDVSGKTPLMYAAAKGHTANLELLIERGADVGIVASNGQTAAQVAAQGGHLEALRVLFASGDMELVPPHECVSAADFVPWKSHVDVLSFAICCGCRLKAPSFLSDNAAHGFCSALYML